MVAFNSGLGHEPLVDLCGVGSVYDPSMPLLITFSVEDAWVALQRKIRAIGLINPNGTDNVSPPSRDVVRLWEIPLADRVIGVLIERGYLYEQKDALIDFLSQRGAKVVLIEIPDTSNAKKAPLQDLHEYVGNRLHHTFEQIFFWRQNHPDELGAPLVKVELIVGHKRNTTLITLPNGVSAELPRSWGVCNWWSFLDNYLEELDRRLMTC